MSARPTIIVVILALIAVAAALYVSHRDSTARTSANQGGLGRTLLGADQLPVDSVERITLQRQREPRLVFERSDLSWRQVEPFEHPMDPYSIRQLAQTAFKLEVIDVIGPEDLSGGMTENSLSLDPPAAEVTYAWPGGSLRLELGRRGLAGRAYLRVAGDETIYVVTQALHERVVETDPKEWRDRTIFPGAGIDADRIEQFNGKTRLVLERERRRWVMREPVQTRVDEVAGPEYFQALGGARSSGFIADQPDDLAKFGLAEPSAWLTIVSTVTRTDGEEIIREQHEQRLIVGNEVGLRSGDRFAMVEGRPVVFKLSQRVGQILFRPPAALADHTASGVISADVRSLWIRGSQGELRLERDLERWFAPDHGGAEVPAGMVTELLEQLTNLRAPEVKIQPFPRELEVATITMHGFDARPIDTIRIAQDSQTGQWALENGDDVLRLFPASMRLRLTPSDFGIANASASADSGE